MTMLDGTRVTALSFVLSVALLSGCSDLKEETTPQEPTSDRPAQVSADADYNRANEIIGRAIEAYGGESARQKLNACKITYRTTLAINGLIDETGTNTVLTEDCFQYPGRLRRTVRRASDNEEMMLFVMNGEDGWMRHASGPVKSMPSRSAGRPAFLATLDQLVQARASDQPRRVEPPEQIDGRELIGVTALSDGHPLSTSYFDTATHLIVRETKYYLPNTQALREGATQAVLTETSYREHKQFDGVTLPTRIVASQGGKPVFDCVILDVTFVSEFPA